MKTSELEQLIQGGRETPRIEFKESCPWGVEKFAKDILAMNNMRDGGYIIIGMAESPEGYKRAGVENEHKNTFKIDKMKDQFAPFAPTSIDFKVKFPKDKKNSQFVVIRVFEFEQIPAICIKDSKDTNAATIYYRNTHEKVQSSPISNGDDLKKLIELATSKTQKRWDELGLLKKSQRKQLKKDLDKELDNFN